MDNNNTLNRHRKRRLLLQINFTTYDNITSKGELKVLASYFRSFFLFALNLPSYYNNCQLTTLFVCLFYLQLSFTSYA